MQTMIALGKREFLSYFRTPVAYVYLVVFLVATVVLAFFVGQFFESNEASLRSMFQFFPWLLIFLGPAMGMRLWSEEKRSGTWELIATLPIRTSEAVLGKFLAAWAFVSLAILLTFPMALTIAYLGSPDWGPVFTGYLGALLVAGSVLAICSLASALTRNQVVSFVISFLICLLWSFLGVGLVANLLGTLFPSWLANALSYISLLTHYEALMLGVLQVRSLLFFLVLTAFALMINIQILKR